MMATRHLFFILAIQVSSGCCAFLDEPRCSKFDFEEKLLEKMVRMEHSTGLVRNEFEEFKEEILEKMVRTEHSAGVVRNEFEEEIRSIQEKTSQLELETTKEQKRLKDLIQELTWDEWGPWGPCAASCSNRAGERLQSRTRGKKNGEMSTTSQTESRPCNSVQFAGCIHPNNGDHLFAVAYDYSHVLAQSTCTAIAPVAYINAVKRTCSNTAPDCAAVCKSVGATCFNALHVYVGTPLPRNAVEKKALQMYRYNSCSGSFCGPNFCCCKH